VGSRYRERGRRPFHPRCAGAARAIRAGEAGSTNQALAWVGAAQEATAPVPCTTWPRCRLRPARVGCSPRRTRSRRRASLTARRTGDNHRDRSVLFRCVRPGPVAPSGTRRTESSALSRARRGGRRPATARRKNAHSGEAGRRWSGPRRGVRARCGSSSGSSTRGRSRSRTRSFRTGSARRRGLKGRATGKPPREKGSRRAWRRGTRPPRPRKERAGWRYGIDAAFARRSMVAGWYGERIQKTTGPASVRGPLVVSGSLNRGADQARRRRRATKPAMPVRPKAPGVGVALKLKSSIARPASLPMSLKSLQRR